MLRPSYFGLPIRSTCPYNGTVAAMNFCISRLLTALAFCAASVIPAADAPDFIKEVRPIFEQHCLKCHGPEKQKGGLRFDVKEGTFKTGESGEQPIIPKNASASRLIKLVTSLKDDEWMPPKGERLAAAEIDVLKRWIDAGAIWPENGNPKTAARAEMIVTDEDRQYWAFRPLTTPAFPRVKNERAVGSPVDRFVIARLEQSNLHLAKEAEAQKIPRRIYFDLIGLPPTPAQMEEFEKQYATDPKTAVATLVDELLASPHYGERWARHWLDVVRYADSDGQESDADRLTAYHFRDFVIQSFNDDLPFNTFVRWQLAGDELEPDNSGAIAATGFIVAGTHAALGDNLMEEERIRERYNELDDMISTTGVSMLGLTLGCARCHDHKYDPIPRRDYYRLMSAFNGGDRAENILAPLDDARRYRAALREWQPKFDSRKKSRDDARNAANKAHEKEAKEKKIESKEMRSLYSDEEKQKIDQCELELKAIEAQKPKALPTAYGFADFGPKPRETFLLARGDFHAKSEPVQLGFLTSLMRGRTPEDYLVGARLHGARNDSTQQRRALAEWMTDLEAGAGPLVARVIVNRVWQHHFGQGLVRTVNDFGVRCDPATHPELLEWLTSEFIKSGWKLKTLHRLIMTSAVYLQDTTFDANAAKIDPDNRLLWRRRPSRLEAEMLRDSMLAVSATLNPSMFGPAIKAPIVAEAIQARNMKDPYPNNIKDTFVTHRRSIYLFHKRVVQQPIMQAFDGPDAQASCGRRENTTVAPQALALLNDSFVRRCAMAFAERAIKNGGESSEDQARWIWREAFGREPSSDEAQQGAAFIKQQIEKRSSRAEQSSNAKNLALTDYCQAIFGLNEFIYID
jgi:hypothetical protein